MSSSVDRIAESIQALENRVWLHTNKWIKDEQSRDFAQSAEAWRSWAMSSTVGAISRVRNAVARDDKTSLPR